MLEKELAQATRMAEEANKRVEKLRARLLAETEKAHARVKRDLDAARNFYGALLGCPEGRSDKDWIDFDFFGHQITAHLIDAPETGAPTGNRKSSAPVWPPSLTNVCTCSFIRSRS